jgi:hypothetical protein
MTTKTAEISNCHLSPKALSQISNALYDAAAVYERLSGDERLPHRLQAQFGVQQHMAKTLAELFESQPAFLVEGVDISEYRAQIWEM